MSHALHRTLTRSLAARKGDGQLSFLESDASLMHGIISLPKVDLHRHLTGSITAAAAVRIAAKYNIELPTYIAAELDRYLFDQDKVSSHRQYFEPWPILNRLFVSLDAVQELLIEVVREASSDNVVYTELRLGPRNFLGAGGEYDFLEYVHAVADGLRRADAQFNTVTRCILGIPRHVFVKFPLASRNKMFGKMLYAIRERPGCFVGVDLNGDELAADAREFATLFKIAKTLELPATVHAGELGSAESVSYAVEKLFAVRIGHGVAAAQNEDTLALLADRRCILELCPTSNKFLGVIGDVRDLPLSNLKERGIPFAICTDNPVRCRTSMSEELFRVAKAFHYTLEDLKSLMKASLGAAFVDEGTRRDLSTRLQ